MKTTIYLEGGGDSKEENVRCREGFRKLLEKCGLNNLPALVACGGRNTVLKDFKTALKGKKKNESIAMLIDSEDPLADINTTWGHLKVRDKWDKPDDAEDAQVLFMATCMETWIVADRGALAEHYGSELQESSLPALVDLESRHRHDVQDRLVKATKDCSNAYAKGKRSYVVLAELNPTELAKHLPSFVRAMDELKKIL